MKTLKIKTNDNVVIITGKDKGKKGKVLAVDVKDNKVKVSGVNMTTKHKKARTAKDSSGIFEQEAMIDASNVMFVCPSCEKPVKIGKKILENGDKVRVCKKCGKELKVTKPVKKQVKKTQSKKKKEDK